MILLIGRKQAGLPRARLKAMVAKMKVQETGLAGDRFANIGCLSKRPLQVYMVGCSFLEEYQEKHGNQRKRKFSNAAAGMLRHTKTQICNPRQPELLSNTILLCLIKSVATP